MSPADRRAALTALDAAAPLARRLGRSGESEETAADIIELWSFTETALRSLLGGAPLSERQLISEVRRRELIGLSTAHSLVDFLAARERVDRPDYEPTTADIQAARTGFESVREGIMRAAPAGEPVLPPRHEPAPPTPVAAAEAPVERASLAPRSTRRMWVIIGAAGLVLLLVIAGAIMLTRPRGAPPELAQGVAAYQAGRPDEAMTLLARAALRDPNRATTYLWMARIHRERREWGAASRSLDRAVQLEPRSPAVHRELGSLLLARGQNEAARSRYVYALSLDPSDRSSMGWLACTLHRLGRFGEAQTWAGHAGSGAWSACLAAPPPAPG